MNMRYYPTIQHERAAKKFVEIFSKDKMVKSILLICSCARGKATKDSCVDMALIIDHQRNYKTIENKFERLLKSVKEFKDILKIGKYSHISVHITTGLEKPKPRDWTSGPDEYELEIGNIFKYSKLLFDRNNYFQRLSKRYLPYYSETLRKKRLNEVKKFMFNNLGHIQPYVARGLYFQAFRRLYDASREFLQALFIKRKVYPIAYDKWIKEQLVEILHEPKLYKEFVSLYEIKHLESNEMIEKAEKLKELAKKYL